jgi:hypothetical protein
MRVMARAVVVFAGAFLFAGAALAEALQPAGRQPSAAPGWGFFLASVLMAFGLYMIVRAWLWDSPTERLIGVPREEGHRTAGRDAPGN